MVKPLRLQKFIASCGICSRRKAEELIASGKVTVNQKIASIGESVTERDVVAIEGKIITIPKAAKETYLLYKPVDYVCSTKDIYAEKLVTELVPSHARLYPVGRLDKNSEGLLLLTNDGNLTHLATHPKFILPKTYEVQIIPNFRKSDIRVLEAGIQDGDEFLTLDNLKILSHNRLLITLHHGKKRHIRRMLAYCHYHVQQLIRTQIGPFSLATLGRESYVRLTEKETKELTEYEI